jgi:hypothetical protein
MPDGSLLVESGPDEVTPFAEAVEASLEPPYRAEAVRRGATAWAVAARRLRTLELAGQDGDELELTLGPDGRRLVVDGVPRLGSLPALEQLVAGAGHVRARRLDGAVWEIEAARL